MAAGKNINHAGRAHALLSASGASRWMSCTPSARLEEGFKSESSVYAAEGTLAHEFAELALRHSQGQMPDEAYAAALISLRQNDLYTDDMEEHVAKYVDHVLESFAEAKALTPDALMLIEERVDLTHYIEEGFGSCDDIIIADSLMIVEDLKYGKGVKVDADNNSQLKLYALGALRRYEMHYDIETVRMSIIQPRLDHISTWEISAEELVAWGETVVKPKAALAYEGKGDLCAGEWCRWCKAAPKCKALADYSMQAAKMEFAKEDPKKADPRILTDDKLAEMYLQIPVIEIWINRVSEWMLDEALKGRHFKDLKLVEGRSVRAWSDSEAVETVLLSNGLTTEQIYSSKLLGIGAVEKILGKAKFNALLTDLIIKPQGKPSLVHSSDKRDAIGTVAARADFGAEPLD